jgi:hypothetical protein
MRVQICFSPTRTPTQAFLAGFFKKNDAPPRASRKRMYSRKKWMISLAGSGTLRR